MLKNFKKQLRQGDIIMHHSHDWISNIIRKYNETHYNHCSIYDKNGFLYEVIGNGIVRKKIEDSIKDQNSYLITIFRVKNLPIEHSEKLIDTIKNYRENSFAHTQILLLFVILWKEKQNLNFILKNLINFNLFIFEKIITKIWDPKNKNMICSELVYRAYMDTAKSLNNHNLVLHIPIECNPLIYPFSKNNSKCSLRTNNINVNSKKIKVNTIEALKGFLKPSEFDIFSLTKYSYQNGKKNINLKIQAKKAAKILRRKDLYNFITPVDLVRSLDTYPVATFKTKSTEKHKTCPVCKN